MEQEIETKEKEIEKTIEKPIEAKDLIDVEVYFNQNTIIYFYSGTWCKSCTKVKSDFYNFIEEKNYILKEKYSIKKEEFKKLGYQYKLIPFFVYTKYIQNSNFAELKLELN